MLKTPRGRLVIEVLGFLGLGATLAVLRFVIDVAAAFWYVIAFFVFGAIIVATALQDPKWGGKARSVLSATWDRRPIMARTYNRLQCENQLHRKRWRFIRELNAIYENRAHNVDQFGGSVENANQWLTNWVRSLQTLIADNPEFTADFPPFDLPNEPYDDVRQVLQAFNDRASIIEAMMGI